MMFICGEAANGKRETQGATLEAQACGLPAIVFNSGGVKYGKDGFSGFVCERELLLTVCLAS
jgi:glycosyltransferase involved in cell wall biosynthesis